MDVRGPYEPFYFQFSNWVRGPDNFKCLAGSEDNAIAISEMMNVAYVRGFQDGLRDVSVDQ